MKRVHNTNAAEIDLTRRYRQEKHFKPRGLWYGIDGDWIRWCKSDMPKWIKPNNFSVDVRKANILVLRTDADMLRFTEQYGLAVVPGLTSMSLYINWPSLALSYDGVEIPKYLWRWRLDQRAPWYYAWDCASGCAWNLDKVKVGKMEAV